MIAIAVILKLFQNLLVNQNTFNFNHIRVYGWSYKMTNPTPKRAKVFIEKNHACGVIKPAGILREW